MQTILAELTVSMSEFKKNPAAILREARNRPVAVLSHGKAALYMVEPALFEAMLEELADQRNCIARSLPASVNAPGRSRWTLARPDAVTC